MLQCMKPEQLLVLLVLFPCMVLHTEQLLFFTFLFPLFKIHLFEWLE